MKAGFFCARKGKKMRITTWNLFDERKRDTSHPAGCNQSALGTGSVPLHSDTVSPDLCRPGAEKHGVVSGKDRARKGERDADGTSGVAGST
jgi:hypothetical protein